MSAVEKKKRRYVCKRTLESTLIIIHHPFSAWQLPGLAAHIPTCLLGGLLDLRRFRWTPDCKEQQQQKFTDTLYVLVQQNLDKRDRYGVGPILQLSELCKFCFLEIFSVTLIFPINRYSVNMSYYLEKKIKKQPVASV